MHFIESISPKTPIPAAPPAAGPAAATAAIEENEAPGHLLPLPGSSSFGVWPWACVRGSGFPARGILTLAAPEAASLIDGVLDAMGDAPLSALDPARREPLARAFAAEALRTSQALRAAIHDGRFREAVAWQNRRALHTGIDALAAKPLEGANKKVRQKERFVASYLQRYCAKNDTIGFFGPVAWARVNDRPEPILVLPGPSHVRRRTVYFEQWGIDALASKLSEDAELRRWAPPRLLPYFRLTGATLHVPFMGPVELAAGQAAILASADGAMPARELAARFAADPAFKLTEEEVYGFLEQSRGMGVIAWDFAIPMQSNPEKALHDALARIGDPAARARALAPLDALESARVRVAGAAGDADALDREMERLEATFHELTGVKPTRADGRVYAARTLVYEDCQRDAQIEIGAGLLEKLGPPLSLLLTSARWVTHQVALRYRQVIEDLFVRLSPGGDQAIDLAVFHKAFAEGEPALADGGATLSHQIAPIQRELQARWAEILGVPPDARRLHYRAAELRSRVERAFSAPGVGWENARYVAPDVMIDAESLEAMERGDYRLVLGEVHLSNTLATTLFVAQHPDVAQLFALIDRDIQAPGVLPLLPKADWGQRTNHALVPPREYRYAFSPDPCPASPELTLRVADLVLARRGGALEVQKRDGSFRFDAVEFMGMLLTMLSLNALQILPDRERSPRIAIDDVIIARETWSFVADRLTFAKLSDPLDRWIEARRWKRAAGLPRFMFVKSPVERKPCYVDMDSPIYVEILAKLIRQTAETSPTLGIRLSEMLPDFEHVWLTDAAGERYTSEIRMVMVDGGRVAPAG